MDKQQDQPSRKINISEVFKKYQGQLKSFIAKRVTAKEGREDILQDVFYQCKTDPVAPPCNKFRQLPQLPAILSLTGKENTGKEIPQARTEEEKRLS
ncbi:MAG: hypothetical protein ACLUDU_06970 [Butyricimonas faecihominis]